MSSGLLWLSTAHRLENPPIFLFFQGICYKRLKFALFRGSMSKAIILLALVGFFLSSASGSQSATSRPATEPRKGHGGEYRSPDKALIARVLPIGKSGWEWAESRVEIRNRNGRLLRFVSFASADHEHGEGVNYGAWTPDSMYFVFSTSSSGGHQPWHGPAYFFSRRHNLIRRLDDYIGVGPDLIFSVSAPDIVHINTYIPVPPGRSIDQYRPVHVKLGRLRVGTP